MAKESYAIRTGLDKSHLDTVFTLRTSDGMGTRPVTFRTGLVVLASLLSLMAVLGNTFVADASVAVKALFCAAWAALTWLLAKPGWDGRPMAERLMDVVDYIPRSERQVLSRTSSSPAGFAEVAQMVRVHEDGGMVEFADGTVGYAYSVVGNASRLLFAGDRDQIVDRVDNYWRTVKPEWETIFVTLREPQRVYCQVGALKRRWEELGPGEPELRAVCDMEYGRLKRDVGARRFSTHQYMLLKAPDPEMLEVARATLRAEVETSDLMFRRVKALKAADIAEMLAALHRPVV